MSKRKLQTIHISGNAQQAAKIMRDKNVGSLLVVSNNEHAKDSKYEGIVTERDLARRVCANDVRTSDVPLGR